MENVGLAFALTLFAGLSTGIGGAIAFFAKKTSTKFLSVSLGFSAGVMIYVSMVEILKESMHTLQETSGDILGAWLVLIGFFSGILITVIIDKLVPAYENPHEIKMVESMDNDNTQPKSARPTKSLMRVGFMTALAIGIHNFPEGLATFMAAVSDPALGLSIAVAIAIHNIPEGIAVSVPVFYATGSKKKAFLYSFLSGLAEPAGALVGFLLLRSVMNDLMFGMVFSAVAGIMVFISFDELLPAAKEYGEHHLSIYGLIAGMAVMGISMIYL
ncbi:MAG: zinc transporter ZupT [Spirochaetales bacterium]|nr:zinc transporter ZupT [Spirochaetales bacterium]